MGDGAGGTGVSCWRCTRRVCIHAHAAATVHAAVHGDGRMWQQGACDTATCTRREMHGAHDARSGVGGRGGAATGLSTWGLNVGGGGAFPSVEFPAHGARPVPWDSPCRGCRAVACSAGCVHATHVCMCMMHRGYAAPRARVCPCRRCGVDVVAARRFGVVGPTHGP